MNQTMDQLAKEYVKRLRKKMKLFKEYPELFEDQKFSEKYIEEGDRFATLAYLYERLATQVRRKARPRPPAAEA